MCIENRIESLNYWIVGIDARLKNQPPPPPPAHSCIETPVEKLALEIAAMKIVDIVQTILDSPSEKNKISEQTHLKISAVISRVLHRYRSRSPVKNKLELFVRTHLHDMINADSLFLIKSFQERDPQELLSVEIRFLETFLTFQMRERRNFQALLVLEYLDFCIYFFAHATELLGGQWKQVRKMKWGKLDWEKIPSLAPEGIAICARLELAAANNELLENLQALTQERSSLEPRTNELLAMWQPLLIADTLRTMQGTYVNACKELLEKGSPTDRNQYFIQAMELATEKQKSVEYIELKNHYRGEKLSFPFSTTFQYLCDQLTKISEYAGAFNSSTGELPSLYEHSYTLYHQALVHQKGFNIDEHPATPEEFRSCSVPVFRTPQEILRELEKPIWFDIFCSGGKKGLCEAMLRVACPSDEPCIQQVLAFLFPVKKTAPQPIASSSTSDAFSFLPPQIVARSQKAKKNQFSKKQPRTTPSTPKAGKKSRAIPSRINPPLLKGSSTSEVSLSPAPQPTSSLLPVEAAAALPPPQKTTSTAAISDSVAEITQKLRGVHIQDDSPPVIPQKQLLLQAGQKITLSQKKAPAIPSIPHPPQEGEKQPISSLAAAASTTSSIPVFRYRMSKPPILAVRVLDWMAYSQRQSDLVEEEWRSVLYHSYPVMIARIIRANTPSTPWVSPTTHRTNEHHSCVGSLHRYKERLPPVIGSFEECFDKNELYHNFFKPSHQKSLITQYRRSGGFFGRVDDDIQSLPGKKKEQGTQPLVERDSSGEYEIQARRFSLILTDRTAGITYTLAFPTPLQEDQGSP